MKKRSPVLSRWAAAISRNKSSATGANLSASSSDGIWLNRFRVYARTLGFPRRGYGYTMAWVDKLVRELSDYDTYETVVGYAPDRR